MNFIDNLVGYYKNYIAQPVKKAYEQFKEKHHSGPYRVEEVHGANFEDSPELKHLIEGIPLGKVAEVTERIFREVEREENRTGHFFFHKDGNLELVLLK